MLDCREPGIVLIAYEAEILCNMGIRDVVASEHAKHGVHFLSEIWAVTLKESGFAGTMNFTNYFHLLKEGDEWKIISKAFFQS